MKSEQQSTLSQDDDSRYSQKSSVCSFNRPSKFSCFNKDCEHNAFVCQDEECQCRRMHEKCIIIESYTLLKDTQTKKIDISKLEILIDQKVNTLIDDLSNVRDRLITKLKEKSETFGLNTSQIKIIKAFQEDNTQKITGKILWNAYNSNNVKENEFKIEQTIKEIQSSMSKIHRQFTQNAYEIQKLLKRLFAFFASQNKISKRFSRVFFQNSKVLTKPQELNTLKFFFAVSQKAMISTKLLYRASENSFKLDKFNQNCGQIENTIVLCETQSGKKIGGFREIAWTADKCLERIRNRNNFMFSLSNEDIFTYKYSSYCQEGKYEQYQNSKNYGPTFGRGPDLAICQKANNLANSLSLIGTSFRNNNYQRGSPSSYEKFNGNTQGNPYFKIKQWQVWKIQLK